MLGMFAATLLPLVSATNAVRPCLTEPNPKHYLAVDSAVTGLPGKSVKALATSLYEAAASPSISASPELLQLARARAAYTWITQNIGYTLDARPNAESTLLARSGNCDAHAVLFAALCAGMHVDCSRVTGYLRFPYAPNAAMAGSAKREEGQWYVAHAWNAVKVGGRWGLVDTTLGTPQSSVKPDDYFLVDPEVFATDHVPDDPTQAFGADVSYRRIASRPILRPAVWRMSPAGFDVDALKPEPGADRSRVVVNLRWQSGMRVSVQTEAGGLQDAALVQPSADGKDRTEIHISSPRSGAIAWLGISSGRSWTPLVGYPVAGASNERFPTLMTTFYDRGAILDGPFKGDLQAGQAAVIRLRAPGASRVIAFQGPEVAGMFERDGDDGWVLHTTPTSGPALQIMASYENESHFEGLLAYKVR